MIINLKPLEDVKTSLKDQMQSLKAEIKEEHSDEIKVIHKIEENYLLQMQNIVVALQIILTEIEKRIE